MSCFANYTSGLFNSKSSYERAKPNYKREFSNGNTNQNVCVLLRVSTMRFQILFYVPLFP